MKAKTFKQKLLPLSSLYDRFIYINKLQSYTMKKVIKRIGNSIGIIYTYEEAKIFNLELGDIIEVSEPKKVKGE